MRRSRETSSVGSRREGADPLVDEQRSDPEADDDRDQATATREHEAQGVG
jgi:hypothetical protein